MAKTIRTIAAAALFFLAFAVIADAYACAERSAHNQSTASDCCVVCCPAHNLAPLSANKNYVASSTAGREILPDHPDFHLEIHLNQIYRPPIV